MVQVNSDAPFVTGPATSVANDSAVFSDTSGKLLKDGGAAAGNVTGPASSVSGNLPSFNGTTGKILQDSGIPAVAARTRAISFIIDGGGSALTTGLKGDLSIPFACTITGARLLADQSGSVVVNVWKDTFANYPPTIADKITASAPPTISSAVDSDDTTLTGWTTAIAAGDTLRFNVDSITTITRVTIILTVTI